EHNLVFWVAYSFGVLAIILQVYIFHIAFTGEGTAKSRFYGFPIARIGIWFLAIQLVLSIVEIAFAKQIWLGAVIIVNLIALALVLIGCITAETMRDEIVRQDEQLKKDVTAMRELQSLSSTLVSQCGDEDLKKKLQKLADDFRYSDPVTSDATKELEEDLRTQMAGIQQAVADGDTEAAGKLCDKISGALAERNRICSISK
ncbi:MAG: hypothetical protein K6E17_01965, partial [Clostridiales bacterium]|nr:hypothetical protein [Clostridiales bacterium]